MPPGPGGGEGFQGGGRRRPAARERQGNEEIRKFLNFYKRRNSLCVDLYLPAFFQRKPSYDDLADFVYSVLSVGGASPPHVVRAAVLDIQLHPVKKLMFIKFTDQLIRDEVVARLQAGLNWPAFDTIVSGWAMDKPMERIRVLGVSPESDEAELRHILGQYGEVLEAQKGLISKKLPGCTNGIWTVKMFVGEGKSLPPFLIMKDDGEVWQLATGEASVCWKCGQHGHIGDKCRQAVNILAESLASTAVGDQPSWAHVVKGGVSVVPTPPPPLPRRPQAQQLIYFKLSSAILKSGKTSLKVVPLPEVKAVDKVGKVVGDQVTNLDRIAIDVVEHSYALLPDPGALIDDDSMDVNPPNSAEAVMKEKDVDNFEEDETVKEGSSVGDFHLQKKAKLSQGLKISTVPDSLSISPDLHHKMPAGSRQQLEQQEDVCSEGGDRGEGVHTNMFGVNYVMWFDVSIEGKDSMDPQEKDWGGKVEFGFSDRTFPKDFEDYFLIFEDDCSTQSHSCAGRIMGVLFEMRDKVLQPPGYDLRNVVDLIDRYRDAHIMDSGWREVDMEEWVN